MNHDSEWHPPHAHDPNPLPPSADPAIVLIAWGREHRISVSNLQSMRQATVDNCTIFSTGHPASGPFTFDGVPLRDLIEHYVNENWTEVDVLSGDGFGARITADELRQGATRPILLALTINERPMSRAEGLVRLIVPRESDDALRQVKWVCEIRLRQ